MLFSIKGQSAMEYLMLIAGAILIAVIVVALLISTGTSNSKNTENMLNKNTSKEVLIPAYIAHIYCTGTQYSVTISEHNTGEFTYYLYINNIEIGEILTNPAIIGSGCLAGQEATILKKRNAEPYGVVFSTEIKI